MRNAIRALALLALCQASLGLAQPAVTGAWIRATPPGAWTAAAYLTITNGAAADRLLGAATTAAASVELHRQSSDAGLTRMTKLADVPLQPGETVQFAPGGLHLMLIDIAAPLAAGTSVAVSLRFAAGGIVTLDVPVVDARTGASPHQHSPTAPAH